jgi:hypothetical protein
VMDRKLQVADNLVGLIHFLRIVLPDGHPHADSFQKLDVEFL